MRSTQNAIAAALLTYFALLATGVVDELYLLISIGLAIAPADLSSQTLKGIVSAISRGEYQALQSVSQALVTVAVVTYILRTALYIGACIYLVIWLLPLARRAFQSLRTQDSLGAVTPEPDIESRRRYVAGALRQRAARKRVESYAFLVAALASLVVAIGFMTREHLFEEPVAIATDTIDVSGTMDQAETLLADARTSSDERAATTAKRDEDMMALVKDHIESEPSASVASAPLSGALVALLQRRDPDPNREFTEAAAIAREYVDFAGKQLAVADHQAKLQVTQSTILTIITRVATLLLVLALVHHLIGLYRRGLALAIDYEAIADAALLGAAEFSSDAQQLRDLFTPRLDEPTWRWRPFASTESKVAAPIGPAAPT